jgi:hypothetical protein
MRRLAPIVLAVALLASLHAPRALSQQGGVRFRVLGVVWRNNVPHLSFSARDLSNPSLTKKLMSGLPQTLVMHVVAYPERRREPVALSTTSCRVVYDLWEEVFRIHRDIDGHERSSTAPSIAEVHEHCLVMRDRPIGRPEDYATARGSDVYFAVAVEQNPISRGTVERIRRWLSRPHQSGTMGGDAFFGSFVSVFVNRQIGSAERVLQFRSPGHGVP